MFTIPLKFRGTVSSRSSASPLLKDPGDTVLIERGYPRWVVMKCPDGCGDELPINIDRKAGPAWRIFQSPRLGLTLYPSVWRDTGCGAHFIVWRNVILLFGAGGDEEYDRFWEDQAYDALRETVLKRLPTREMVHFSEIADELGELPWDVLRVCRDLVRQKLAVEGDDKLRQHFKKTRK